MAGLNGEYGASVVVGLTNKGQLNSNFNGSGIALMPFTESALNIPGDTAGPLSSSGVLDITILENGDILTAQMLADGVSSYYSTTEYWTIACYTPSGALDTSFGPLVDPADTNGTRTGIAAIEIPDTKYIQNNGINSISMIVEPDSTIVLGGSIVRAYQSDPYFDHYPTLVLAAFNANGTVDDNFGNQGSSEPGLSEVPLQEFEGEWDSYQYPMAINQIVTTEVNGQTDIVTGGTVEDSYGVSQFIFAEFDSTGNLNESFGSVNNPGYVVINPSGSTLNELESLAVLQDGSIVGVGDNNYQIGLGAYAGESEQLDIVKLTPSGSLDSSFFATGQYPIPDPYTYLSQDKGINLSLVHALAIDGNDWVIVGGAYSGASGIEPPSSGDTASIFLMVFDPEIYGQVQLTATASSTGQVNLNWSAAGDSDDSFGIKRKLAGSNGPYVYVGATAAGADTYSDATVQENTSYLYEVYAITPVGPQGTSLPASVTTMAADQGYQYVETVNVPIFGQIAQSVAQLQAGVPYLLVATGDISQTEDGAHRGDAEYGYFPVDGKTNWWLNSTLGYQYGISVGANTAAMSGFYTKYPYWGPLATDSNHTYSILYTPTSTGYLLANYHDNYYPDNSSSNPGDIPLQLAIYEPLPPTPEDLNAVGDTTAGGIQLSWTLPTASWLSGLYSGSENVLLQRSSDGGTTFTTLATVPALTPTWLDNDVAANTAYTYRIVAQVGSDQSRPSNLAPGILNVNPPNIQPVLPQTAYQTVPWSYQIVATDTQTKLSDFIYKLTYSAIDDYQLDLSGLKIGSTGLISGFTPTPSEQGHYYELTVTVTNAHGVSGGHLF